MGENTTSYDHEYEYLEYSQGPFDVSVSQSDIPACITLKVCRGQTVLVLMDLNRASALKIAGLITGEVRYLDHLTNRRG